MSHYHIVRLSSTDWVGIAVTRAACIRQMLDSDLRYVAGDLDWGFS